MSLKTKQNLTSHIQVSEERIYESPSDDNFPKHPVFTNQKPVDVYGSALKTICVLTSSPVGRSRDPSATRFTELPGSESTRRIQLAPTCHNLLPQCTHADNKLRCCKCTIYEILTRKRFAVEDKTPWQLLRACSCIWEGRWGWGGGKC